MYKTINGNVYAPWNFATLNLQNTIINVWVKQLKSEEVLY